MHNGNLLLLLIVAGCALALNLVFTPLLVALSHKYGWYDEINHRKIHTGQIPRIGGVGIFLSFLIVSLVLVLAPGLLPPRVLLVHFLRYAPFVLAFAIVHLLGLIDDFTDLRPRIKILFQGAAALIVTLAGHGFSSLYVPFVGTVVNLGPFSYVVTFVWLLGMCNAVNLIDGLDGLAGGTAAIAAIFLGMTFWVQHNYTTALFSLALAGGLAGFLVFNMPPARLFMGDSGALFVGFALASLPLLEPSRIAPGMPILISVTVLLVPILDTIAAILRRLRRRRPIGQPDREHIHHKLLDLGMTNAGILAVIYAIGAILGVSALLWILHPVDGMFRWVLIAWIVAIGFFLVLDQLNRRRVRAKRQ